MLICILFKIVVNQASIRTKSGFKHTDNNLYVRWSLQPIMFIALWISICGGFFFILTIENFVIFRTFIVLVIVKVCKMSNVRIEIFLSKHLYIRLYHSTMYCLSLFGYSNSNFYLNSHLLWKRHSYCAYSKRIPDRTEVLQSSDQR